MAACVIEPPGETERRIRIRCPDHAEEEFQPERPRVAFYYSGCGFETEVRLHDTHDWRDWGKQC